MVKKKILPSAALKTKSFSVFKPELSSELSISNGCINFHLAQPSPFDYREGTGMQNEYYTNPLDSASGFKLMSRCQPRFQPVLAVKLERYCSPSDPYTCTDTQLQSCT